MKNKKKLILIVEDEMLIATNITKALEADLYEVADKAITGEDAIEKFQQSKPDLVLMDINLKGKMDGIETANKIQKITDTPIVFLTAYSDKTTIQRVKPISPYGFILKPFRKRELNIVIEMALSKYDYEKKLEESTKRYRGLVDNAPIGILSTNNQGKILDINPELLYILGFSSIEMAQRINVFEYKPMVQCGITREMKECLKNKEITGSEYTYIAESGKSMMLRSITKPELDEDGNTMGVLLIIEDITERNEIESELYDKEEKLAMTLLGSNIGLFDCNIKTGEILYFGKDSYILGYAPGEIDLTLDSWKDHIHPEDISEVSSRMQNNFDEKNDFFESEYRIKNKSGEWKWVISKGTVIKRDENRKPLRMIGTHHDITEYKHNKETLKLYNQKLDVMIHDFPFLAMLWERNDDEFILMDYNKHLIELSMSEISNYKGIEAKIYFKDNTEIIGDMKKCLSEKNKISNKQVLYNNQFTNEAKDVLFNYIYIPLDQVLVYIDENGGESTL